MFRRHMCTCWRSCQSQLVEPSCQPDLGTTRIVLKGVSRSRAIAPQTVHHTHQLFAIVVSSHSLFSRRWRGSIKRSPAVLFMSVRLMHFCLLPFPCDALFRTTATECPCELELGTTTRVPLTSPVGGKGGRDCQFWREATEGRGRGRGRGRRRRRGRGRERGRNVTTIQHFGCD